MRIAVYAVAGLIVLQRTALCHVIANDKFFSLRSRNNSLPASYIKVHPHGAGASGGNQAMGRTKGD